jgi:hypothetical protein
MKKILFLLLSLMTASAGWAGTGTALYDYPFVNAYEATVLGTPEIYMAAVPEKINIKEFDLTVFEDRNIPEAFWYYEGLKCSLVYQENKAPLIFNIAGTGSAYNSGKMKAMQKAFFKAGYHVISISSPTHPNFIVSASETMVPGYITEDARDLYRVMELAWREVKDSIQVSEFYITGYSLGAAQAAFIAKLDEQRRTFNFKKVLLINPPVNLFNSVNILDKMLVDNVPGGLDNMNAAMDKLFIRISEYYKETNHIDLTDPDFLYELYKFNPPKEQGLAALIGLSFRISSSNMIFASDVMTDGGFIFPKGLTLTSYTPLSDYGVVTFRTSFTDYFNEYFYPYFQKREPGLAKAELVRRVSLESIADYLSKSPKIGLMTNDDDLILAQGEVDFFRQVFGSRAKIYPTGGHCGNMGHKVFVSDMINFFKK